MVQWRALVTMASASITPNPNSRLVRMPAPFFMYRSSVLFGLLVYTIKYCTSLQVKSGLCNDIIAQSKFGINKLPHTYLASKARAIMPAVIGVDELVPPKLKVHPPYPLVVTCFKGEQNIFIQFACARGYSNV